MFRKMNASNAHLFGAVRVNVNRSTADSTVSLDIERPKIPQEYLDIAKVHPSKGTHEDLRKLKDVRIKVVNGDFMNMPDFLIQLDEKIKSIDSRLNGECKRDVWVKYLILTQNTSTLCRWCSKNPKNYKKVDGLVRHIKTTHTDNLLIEVDQNLFKRMRAAIRPFKLTDPIDQSALALATGRVFATMSKDDKSNIISSSKVNCKENEDLKPPKEEDKKFIKNEDEKKSSIKDEKKDVELFEKPKPSSIVEPISLDKPSSIVEPISLDEPISMVELLKKYTVEIQILSPIDITPENHIPTVMVAPQPTVMVAPQPILSSTEAEFEAMVQGIMDDEAAATSSIDSITTSQSIAGDQMEYTYADGSLDDLDLDQYCSDSITGISPKVEITPPEMENAAAVSSILPQESVSEISGGVKYVNEKVEYNAYLSQNVTLNEAASYFNKLNTQDLDHLSVGSDDEEEEETVQAVNLDRPLILSQKIQYATKITSVSPQIVPKITTPPPQAVVMDQSEKEATDIVTQQFEKITNPPSEIDKHLKDLVDKMPEVSNKRKRPESRGPPLRKSMPAAKCVAAKTIKMSDTVRAPDSDDDFLSDDDLPSKKYISDSSSDDDEPNASKPPPSKRSAYASSSEDSDEEYKPKPKSKTPPSKHSAYDFSDSEDSEEEVKPKPKTPPKKNKREPKAKATKIPKAEAGIKKRTPKPKTPKVFKTLKAPKTLQTKERIKSGKRAGGKKTGPAANTSVADNTAWNITMMDSITATNEAASRGDQAYNIPQINQYYTLASTGVKPNTINKVVKAAFLQLVKDKHLTHTKQKSIFDPKKKCNHLKVDPNGTLSVGSVAQTAVDIDYVSRTTNNLDNDFARWCDSYHTYHNSDATPADARKVLREDALKKGNGSKVWKATIKSLMDCTSGDASNLLAPLNDEIFTAEPILGKIRSDLILYFKSGKSHDAAELKTFCTKLSKYQLTKAFPDAKPAYTKEDEDSYKMWLKTDNIYRKMINLTPKFKSFMARMTAVLKDAENPMNVFTRLSVGTLAKVFEGVLVGFLEDIRMVEYQKQQEELKLNLPPRKLSAKSLEFDSTFFDGMMVTLVRFAYRRYTQMLFASKITKRSTGAGVIEAGIVDTFTRNYAAKTKSLFLNAHFENNFYQIDRIAKTLYQIQLLHFRNFKPKNKEDLRQGFVDRDPELLGMFNSKCNETIFSIVRNNMFNFVCDVALNVATRYAKVDEKKQITWTMYKDLLCDYTLLEYPADVIEALSFKMPDRGTGNPWMYISDKEKVNLFNVNFIRDEEDDDAILKVGVDCNVFDEELMEE